jgi:hypothetical protein
LRSGSFLFCPCGADGPRGVSSSRVLARLRFRSVVALSFRWERFRTVRGSGRMIRGCLEDSPRAPRGRSVIRSRLWRFCLLYRTVRSSGRTIRSKGANCPRYPAGPLARPSRTVRAAWPDGPPEAASFASWLDSSLPFSCFCVCFKESFLGLEVDP